MDTKKYYSEIGFIGLGIMGKPMVLNLLKSGYQVTFFARKKKIINEASKHGGKYVEKISDISKNCKYIFLNLPNSKNVENIIMGKDGLINNLQKSSTILDMSTIAPETAIKMSKKLSQKKCYFIDAPVSGGEIGAINASLSIMVGGEKRIFDRIRPLLSVLGKNITYVGKSGSGQITKACNQILAAGTMIAVSEILLLAKKSKCDPKLVKKALMGGFANSKVLDLHGERMIQNNYKAGFKAALHLKDLNIAMNIASKLGLKLENAKYSKKIMKQAIKDNHGNKDSSIINKIVQKINK